jgi:hypothetical protein
LIFKTLVVTSIHVHLSSLASQTTFSKFVAANMVTTGKRTADEAEHDVAQPQAKRQK